MKILIACEESGIVTSQFKNRGHDVVSCDLLPTRGNPATHIQGDVLEILYDTWDLVIAFPPCTHLCSSGARWWEQKRKDGRQQQGIEFFMEFVECQAQYGGKLCIENPVGIMSSLYRKPDQIIQPWMFGHGETKATCLWLWGLPRLVPTNVVEGRTPRIHQMAPSANRSRDRSETYLGIAEAMAYQWG